MNCITEKNKAWKISFENDNQRQNAVEKLKSRMFNIDDYSPELLNEWNGFLFISTYDDERIGCWDTLDVFEEDGRCKTLEYNELLKMCEERE